MLTRLLHQNRRDFDSLDEREILSLAVAAEEEDGAIYAEIAIRLGSSYPASAKVFEGMAAEEDEHRRRLLDLYTEKFGPRLVPIRREHVRGFISRRPVWLMQAMSLEQVRQLAWEMEEGAVRFYEAAAGRSTDVAVRKLLGDLAADERKHADLADRLESAALGPEERAAERSEEHRQFVLTWVQPGLAGLMDGSVSTLAPIFATAFATQNTATTFTVALAASVGAGISMGFTEAPHDDGVLSGRGSPVKRGIASGVMTTVGGLGHALPYLIPHFWTATALAGLHGVLRVVGHRLDPEPLHGDAVHARGAAGRARRRAGAGGGHSDRQRLTSGIPAVRSAAIRQRSESKFGRPGVDILPGSPDRWQNQILAGDLIMSILRFSRAALLSSVFTLPLSFAAAAADLLILSPEPIARQDVDFLLPAVSGPNGKLELSLGAVTDPDNAMFRAAGSVSLPVGDAFGVQGDLAFETIGGDWAMGGALHAFTRDPSSYLFGVTAGIVVAEGAWLAGIGPEAELYLDRISLEGWAGWAALEYEDPMLTDENGFFVIGDLAWYPTDDWRLSVGGASVLGRQSLRLATEYQLADFGLPFSGTGEVRAYDTGGLSAKIGIKGYFGDRDKSLIDRHRQDDPPNRVLDLFAGAGSLLYALAEEEGPLLDGEGCIIGVEEWIEPEGCVPILN
jgi:rubrerythrin